MTPRFGKSPKPGQTYKRRQGVYAILPREGQLLVTHQAAPFSEVQLPGGGIDPGESPLAALHREVFEETGWSIAAPRRFGAFRHYTYMPDYDLWAEKLCTIYVAHPVRRQGPPSEAGHTALWMDPEDALEEIASPGDQAFLASYLNQLA